MDLSQCLTQFHSFVTDISYGNCYRDNELTPHIALVFTLPPAFTLESSDAYLVHDCSYSDFIMFMVVLAAYSAQNLTNIACL